MDPQNINVFYFNSISLTVSRSASEVTGERVNISHASSENSSLCSCFKYLWIPPGEQGSGGGVLTRYTPPNTPTLRYYCFCSPITDPFPVSPSQPLGYSRASCYELRVIEERYVTLWVRFIQYNVLLIESRPISPGNMVLISNIHYRGKV